MSKKHPNFFDRLLHSVGVRIWGTVLLLFAVATVVAWSYLPPPLPEFVRLGTGRVGATYERFGKELRREMLEHGVELALVASVGSRENIRLLLNGEIDVGLVQSGNLSDAEASQLESIATVFYELVLVVQRAGWDSEHIKGGRIAIGLPGSGVHRLALELLDDRGIREGVPPGTRLMEIGGERAVKALQAGEVDSAVFVTSLDVPWVRTLFTDPDLELANFEQAEAFTRHYRYLRRIVIPAGLIDLPLKIPPLDVSVIATTASLVIRPNTHRALIPLLIESSREQLYEGSLLAAPGEFPSGHGVEAPLADEAFEYFERGPSFFYRWLPFRYAFAVTRLMILLLPLLTLLYPLFSSMRPIYPWIIQRRVYRWYRVLWRIEKQMDTIGDAASLGKIHEELKHVGDEIRGTNIPASYGASLFALRAHRRLLVGRLESLMKAARGL